MTRAHRKPTSARLAASCGCWKSIMPLQRTSAVTPWSTTTTATVSVTNERSREHTAGDFAAQGQGSDGAK